MSPKSASSSHDACDGTAHLQGLAKAFVADNGSSFGSLCDDATHYQLGFDLQFAAMQ